MEAPIVIPNFLDLYDELLKKGYEGKCTEGVHDVCCPFGVRLKAAITRDLTGFVPLEKARELNQIMEMMLEGDKVIVYKVFFDSFWEYPFRHACQLITEDGLNTFVAYLVNCMALGSVDDVVRTMRDEIESQTNADQRTIANADTATPEDVQSTGEPKRKPRKSKV